MAGRNWDRVRRERNVGSAPDYSIERLPAGKKLTDAERDQAKASGLHYDLGDVRDQLRDRDAEDSNWRHPKREAAQIVSSGSANSGKLARQLLPPELRQPSSGSPAAEGPPDIQRREEALSADPAPPDKDVESATPISPPVEEERPYVIPLRTLSGSFLCAHCGTEIRRSRRRKDPGRSVRCPVCSQLHRTVLLTLLPKDPDEHLPPLKYESSWSHGLPPGARPSEPGWWHGGE